MEYAKNSALFFIIAVAINGISVAIQSDFLEGFLNANLITLLVALLAINTTTMGLISSKMKDLHDKYDVDFSTTIRSMRSSIIEQVVLVVIAAIVSIAKGSTLVTSYWAWLPFVFDTVLITIFIYAIHILYDTANGVFILLHADNEE